MFSTFSVLYTPASHSSVAANEVRKSLPVGKKTGVFLLFFFLQLWRGKRRVSGGQKEKERKRRTKRKRKERREGRKRERKKETKRGRMKEKKDFGVFRVRSTAHAGV